MALSGRRLGAGHDLRLFRSAQHPTLFHKVIDLVEVEIAVELCGEWVDLFSGDPLVLIGCGNAPEQAQTAANSALPRKTCAPLPSRLLKLRVLVENTVVLSSTRA